MPDGITEWEFTGDVASWINELLAVNEELPFSRAKCEQRSAGSRKRRDLTLLDENEKVVLTGEVKLPYRPQGGSPYNHDVVKDARSKAQRAGADYFFTWNVNQFVLWETEPSGPAWRQRSYRDWEVTNVHRPAQLEGPPAQHAVQSWLGRFLHDFAKIVRGTDFIAAKAPDAQFVDMLECALATPIRLTFESLRDLYEQPAPRSRLDEWMRDDLGFIIADDQNGIEENLDRAARFACYNLVNKLVFYDALLKRHGATLPKLHVPDHIDTGEELRSHLEVFFADAKTETGDYETVFGEDHLNVGNRVPFYSDAAVSHWAELINDINDFDFTRLDYEVIGSIFERLISPEERHKYGQYYTRVEVVDLINSFCIRRGDESVMDPACGGGTFLVRAYARKKALQPNRRHSQLLSDLYGVDVSDFATHLTTINLATRELVDEENYPQVIRSDFFDVRPKGSFIVLPTTGRSQGLGSGQQREVHIDGIDAVVGNPPYIQQEDIPKKRKDEYNNLVEEEAGANLSRRSDIHCYFWPHAAYFLTDEGYLCYLTSSQWLDSSYGFKLQNWILRNFEVVAVLESREEPWFVGARVTTTVTILRRQPDEAARMDNTVRFVQLRRPLEEIMAHDGTVPGAIEAANAFRDELLGAEENAANLRYRIRLVSQSELWEEGVRIGKILGRSGGYHGAKWGVYLRAPDMWFDMLDESGKRMQPLGELAEIRFGVKTGKDCFFFPIDCSEECLDQHPDESEFRSEYGLPREEVAAGRVKLVKCGRGRDEIRPIESRYLEPEVHSLMEVDGFTVQPDDCSRMVLLVGEDREELAGTYVHDYIKWGEEQGWHKGSTCASRATETRQWYDLTGHERGSLFWPKSQQYKHAIPLNEQNLQCNCNLYDVHPIEGVDPEVLAGILNSTTVVLAKHLYGRPVGVEGNLKTEVVDTNMMPVPDPEPATDEQRERVAEAFRNMKGREARQFLSKRRLRRMSYHQKGKESELPKLPDKCELDMEDRRELDDAVLEMMGISDPARRGEIIDDLYRYLREFFEMTRQKEEKAIRNKKRARRRGRRTPADIAEQIRDWIEEYEPRLLREYDPHFIDHDEPYNVYEVPAEGKPRITHDVFDGQGVRFVTGRRETEVGFVETRNAAQQALVSFLAETGHRGLTRVPLKEEECKRVQRQYQAYHAERDQRLWQLIEERTADEDTQQAVYEKLLPML